MGWREEKSDPANKALRLDPKNNEDREKCWVWEMT